MNIERLNHLVTIMEELQATRKAFNLHSWISADNADSRSTVGDTTETCGTTCCALGYAALDPAFQAQGLGMRLENDWNGERFGEVRSVTDFNKVVAEQEAIDPDVAILGIPMFGDEEAFDAGAEFFGITRYASYYLFDPAYYSELERPAQPSDVVAHIKEVIAHNGAHPQEGED